MSADMPACAICGQTLVCVNPHPDPPAQPLQVKKGAIYVCVRDDHGDGVPGVPVSCAGKNPLSDPTGFAYFDPLDEGSYAASVSLAFKPALDAKFYVASMAAVNADVKPGQITLVEFQLDRYSTLKATVKRSDNDDPVKDVDVELRTSVPGAAPPTPKKKTLENGEVEFDKLKRALYKATATLGGADKDHFVIKGPSAAECSVDPDRVNTVQFLAGPLYWITFKLVDEKDKPLEQTVTLSLEQVGQAKVDQQSDLHGLLEMKHLEPGKMKVHRIDLKGHYELVNMTSA